MDTSQTVFEFTACLRLLNAGISGMRHRCRMFGVYFTSQPRRFFSSWERWSDGQLVCAGGSGPSYCVTLSMVCLWALVVVITSGGREPL